MIYTLSTLALIVLVGFVLAKKPIQPITIKDLVLMLSLGVALTFVPLLSNIDTYFMWKTNFTVITLATVIFFVRTFRKPRTLLNTSLKFTLLSLTLAHSLFYASIFLFLEGIASDERASHALLGQKIQLQADYETDLFITLITTSSAFWVGGLYLMLILHSRRIKIR